MKNIYIHYLFVSFLTNKKKNLKEIWFYSELILTDNKKSQGENGNSKVIIFGIGITYNKQFNLYQEIIEHAETIIYKKKLYKLIYTKNNSS